MIPVGLPVMSPRMGVDQLPDSSINDSHRAA